MLTSTRNQRLYHLKKMIDEDRYQMADLSGLEQLIGKNAFLHLLRTNLINIDSNDHIWLP